MVNANGEKLDDQSSKDKELEERYSDATSDKTVSDLEETETDSSPTHSGLDPGPSPDGTLDERDVRKG